MRFRGNGRTVVSLTLVLLTLGYQPFTLNSAIALIYAETSLMYRCGLAAIRTLFERCKTNNIRAIKVKLFAVYRTSWPHWRRGPP